MQWKTLLGISSETTLDELTEHEFLQLCLIYVMVTIANATPVVDERIAGALSREWFKGPDVPRNWGLATNYMCITSDLYQRPLNK